MENRQLLDGVSVWIDTTILHDELQIVKRSSLNELPDNANVEFSVEQLGTIETQVIEYIQEAWSWNAQVKFDGTANDHHEAHDYGVRP